MPRRNQPFGPYATGRGPSDTISQIFNMGSRQAAAPAPTPPPRPLANVFLNPRQSGFQHPFWGSPAPTPTPKGVFPTRYDDPMYDEYDAISAAEVGVPLELLRNIRLSGERSNNGQVSSAGAQTPYQFIPSTREAFRTKYGVDAYADPQSASRAAALHLKESYDRTGSWQQAVREYIGGPNPENHGPVTASYVDRVMQAFGGAGAPVLQSGFDPRYFNQAQSTIGQASQLAMQPFETSVARPPRPEMPELPADMPHKDFAAQDALMASLAPQAFGEEESQALGRRRLWQGAAQALASLDDDSGIGTILARVGAGMLGGRLSANDEIQARADAFDEQMRNYNLLKLQHEDTKAQQAFDEATAEAGLAYQHSWAKFTEAARQFDQDNTWGIQGNAFVSSSVGPNGELQVKTVPIASMTLPQFAMQRAQIQAGMGSAANQASQANAALVNSSIAQAAIADATEGQGDAGVGMGQAALAFAAPAITAGYGEQILGPEVWADAMDAANQHAAQIGNGDPEAIADARQQYLSGVLAQYLASDVNAQAKFEELLPLLVGMQDTRRSVRRRAGTTVITDTER